MSNKSFIIILFAAFLSSCAAKISPGEKLLFPDDTEGKWWIINVITNDSTGNRVHLSALISTETENVKNYTVFFSSLWTASDSSFYSSVQATDKPDISLKNRFPLTIGIADTSSTAGSFNWVLKRKTMHWEATVKSNDPAAASALFNMDVFFKEQQPFSFSKLSSTPVVWATAPLLAEVNMGDRSFREVPAHLFIRTITGKQILLNETKSNHISWVDLIMNDGKKLSLLLRTINTGEVSIIASSFWDESNNIFYDPSLQVKQTTGSSGKAVKSGKTYPLSLTITSQEKNYSLLVSPTTREQEIAAGKRSLWMGAVEATESTTGRRIGVGNMYIFGQ